MFRWCRIVASGSSYASWTALDNAYPPDGDNIPFENVATGHRKVIQYFILKAPTSGYFQNTIDFTLPSAVRTQMIV
jgi:hypothetical protein